MFRSEEDYLKQIYELSIERGRERIRLSELAETLGYSDQSVNEKVRKLVEKDYVVFEPYKGITLTPTGVSEALRMIRSHRLWEVFLHRAFGYSWMELHEDAEELEHASSPRVIESLYRYLGEPKYCNHGNPIPDLDGHAAPIAEKPLDSCETGDSFTLRRVLDYHELLELLDHLEIGIDDTLIVKSRNEFAGYLEVLHNGQTKQITLSIASMLFTFDQEQIA